MKKAYLSISFQNRKHFQKEIIAIEEVLSECGFKLFVFVDVFHFSADQEKEMMQQAWKEIDESDLLIAEVSEKAIGVGIEIGYAIARNKTVIYLRREDAEHSTTASGSAKYSIIYRHLDDLSVKLRNQLLVSGD
jgi:nucleoside 2-deoxyribosyltransferase